MNLVKNYSYDHASTKEAKDVLNTIKDRLENRRFIAHCPTQEDFKLIVDILRYFNVACLEDLVYGWPDYEEHACISFSAGDIHAYFGSLDYYLRNCPDTLILEYNSKNLDSDVILRIKNIIKKG